MDKVQIAKDIATIRRTGLTNMYDRRKVIDLLHDFDCDDSANYLSENKNEYMELLILSGDY